MKIYQVDYQEQTIISKFINISTTSELEAHQFLTEYEADDAMRQHLQSLLVDYEVEEPS